MNFILCTITAQASKKELNKNIYEKVLKNLAFERRIETDQNIIYRNILFPKLEQNTYSDKEIFQTNVITSKLTYNSLLVAHRDDIFSIAKILYNIEDIDWRIEQLTIDIEKNILDENLSITYTDGSNCKKSTGSAITQLTKKSKNTFAEYDDFTNATWLYKTYSQYIANGTNNIGELTAIKLAIEKNISNKDNIVIISDSIYCINIFRDWLYNKWTNNNFIGSNGKVISNKDIILLIKDLIDNNSKTIFFKWIKGHSKNKFNDICDKLAKQEVSKYKK